MGTQVELKNEFSKLRISEKLSNYIVTTSFEDLPEKAIKSAKMTILDSITCMLGGVFTPAGEILTAVIAKEGGPLESTIIGTGHKTSALLAAFTNSHLANAVDFDDYYPLCHPSATIVPPGIAVSEAYDGDGKTFITSVVIASEVHLRIMDSILGSTEQQFKIFGPATHQTFGAVVAAGKILQLNEEQMARAIGIAGANAPVPCNLKTFRGDTVTMVKNPYGTASFVSVLAAKLAKSGFIGPLDIFEGDTGFWRMSGSDLFDPSKMTEGLGRDFKITKIAFKPYPCCRWTHSSLDGIFQIVEKNKISPDKVKKVEVRTFSIGTKPFLSKSHPKTFTDVQFSTKYLMSLAILKIPPGLNWYRKELRNSEEVLRLADKIILIDDEEANSCYPTRLLSKVTLYTPEATFRARVEFPRGAPENPMGEEDLKKKFLKVSEGILDDSQRYQCLEFIQDLERKDNLRELTNLLTFKDKELGKMRRGIFFD